MRHRCWLLCGSANYAPLLDAGLTFNAAALTRRHMQLSNAAALPLGLRSCLSVAFNSKKTASKKEPLASICCRRTNAIVPTVIWMTDQGTGHCLPLCSECQDMNCLNIYLPFHNHQLLYLSRNLTPQNLIILS